MEVISALGIFAAVFYLFLLLGKKKKSLSDRILIVWMILFSVHLVLPLMMARGNRFFIEEVDGKDVGLYTLHLTFMFYYTLSLTKRNFKLKTKHILYLIPTFLVYVIQNIINQISISSENGLLLRLISVVILNLVFCAFFSIKSFQLLRKHKHRITNSFSYTEKIDLKWLQNLVIASIILTSLLFFEFLAIIFGKMDEHWLNNFYFSSMSIFVVFLGYGGYRQIEIVIQQKNNPYRKAKKKNVKQASKPSLDNNSQIQLLTEYMNREKPHLDPELNIGILANQLKIHSHLLSKLINTQFGQNFFEFVNSYRVEEFKKLVANPKNKHFSILGLALDAGFNSKASFNRIFKNSTGLTPSEFRNQYKF